MTDAGSPDQAVAHEQPRQPHAALKRLDVMVGTWNMEGRVLDSGEEIRGQIALEWLDGGHYLVQRVDTDYAGHRIIGTEYVG
jgi:hypothetical protein